MTTRRTERLVRRRLGPPALLLLTLAGLPEAHADEDPAAPQDASSSEPEAPRDEASEGARQAFLEGTALARQAQWSQALEAFRRAQSLKPHPVTTYNIGTCYRAIGAYTQAHLAFEQARREHEADDMGELPDTLLTQSRAFLDEIERLLVTVELEVVPTGAQLAVDGRPLLERGGGDEASRWAGVQPPGPGDTLEQSRVTIFLDPGAHVFTFTRPGFETAVINETFAPGTERELRLELDKLPGRLQVSATVEGALVSLDGKEIGPTPLEVARPAGRYELLVDKDGYEPHTATIDLSPGQRLDVRVPMRAEQTSVFETWWFWSATAVVIAGGITATYFLTRPEPEPPAYDGGSLDWVAFPEGATLRF